MRILWHSAILVPKNVPQKYYPQNYRTTDVLHLRYMKWRFDYHIKTNCKVILFHGRSGGQELYYQRRQRETRHTIAKRNRIKHLTKIKGKQILNKDIPKYERKQKYRAVNKMKTLIRFYQARRNTETFNKTT